MEFKRTKKKNNIEEARRRQKDSNYDTLGKNSPLGISLLPKRGPLKAWWDGGRNIPKGGLVKN